MLNILYSNTSKAFISELDALYNKKRYAIVNFLYFANSVQYHLLENITVQSKDDILYANALTESDFLLPD